MQQELGKVGNGHLSAEASSTTLSLFTHMKGLFAGLLICLGVCLLVAVVEVFLGFKRKT